MTEPLRLGVNMILNRTHLGTEVYVREVDYDALRARVEALEAAEARLAEAERDRPALLACEQYIRSLDALDEEVHDEACSHDFEDDDPMKDCDCFRIDCRRLVEAIDAARSGQADFLRPADSADAAQEDPLQTCPECDVTSPGGRAHRQVPACSAATVDAGKEK